MRGIPHELLSDILACPPQPYARRTAEKAGTRQGRAAAAAAAAALEENRTSSETDRLRIVDVKPAGDVVHVFSHIKKTYRIQWVLLEGGGPTVPALSSSSASAMASRETSKQAKVGKRAGKRQQATSQVGDIIASSGGASRPSAGLAPAAGAMWKRLEDVSDAKCVERTKKKACLRCHPPQRPPPPFLSASSLTFFTIALRQFRVRNFELC